MEEDIKILELFKNRFEIVSMNHIGLTEDETKEIMEFNYVEKVKIAIENLIKAYKELEKRNKELFKTCCKYEDTLEHYEYKIFDELDDYIKLDEISKLDKIGIKGKKYISESLIKEKIEELKVKRENISEGSLDYQLRQYNYIGSKIDVLEELLTPLKNV